MLLPVHNIDAFIFRGVANMLNSRLQNVEGS